MYVTVTAKELNNEIELYLLDEDTRFFFCMVVPNGEEKDVAKYKQRYFILETIAVVRKKVKQSINKTSTTPITPINLAL